MSRQFLPIILAVLLAGTAGCSQSPDSGASWAAGSSSQQDFTSQSLPSSEDLHASSSSPAASSTSSADSAASKNASSSSLSASAAAFGKAQGLAQKLSDLYEQQGCSCSEIQSDENTADIQGDPAVTFTATLPQDNNPAETAKVRIWISDNLQADLETMTSKLENNGEMRVMSQWSGNGAEARIIRNNRSNLNFLLLLDQNGSLIVQIEDSAPEILPVSVSVLRDFGYPLDDSFN